MILCLLLFLWYLWKVCVLGTCAFCCPWFRFIWTSFIYFTKYLKLVITSTLPWCSSITWTLFSHLHSEYSLGFQVFTHLAAWSVRCTLLNLACVLNCLWRKRKTIASCSHQYKTWKMTVNYKPHMFWLLFSFPLLSPWFSFHFSPTHLHSVLNLTVFALVFFHCF